MKDLIEIHLEQPEHIWCEWCDAGIGELVEVYYRTKTSLFIVLYR
jgi:hypothetical protein